MGRKSIWVLQWATLSYTSLFLFAGSAGACIMKEMPQLNDLARYDRIVIGEVQAVHVYDHHTDLTAPHDLSIEVTRVLKGSAPEKLELDRVTGCGLEIPEVGSIGAFFFESNHHMVPVYQHEENAFREFVGRVIADLGENQ